MVTILYGIIYFENSIYALWITISCNLDIAGQIIDKSNNDYNLYIGKDNMETQK